MAKPISTHTQAEISRIEETSALKYAGFMATEAKDALVPVFVRPDSSQERAAQVVYKANGMGAGHETV